jgi:diaminopimelate decarboxylase
MKSSLTYGQLKQAAEKFGTPLYVYHAEKIVAQYQNLVTHFDMNQTRFFLRV